MSVKALDAAVDSINQQAQGRAVSYRTDSALITVRADLRQEAGVIDEYPTELRLIARVLIEDVPNPKQGDFIFADGRRYRVDRIERDAGLWLLVLLADG